MEGRRPEAEPLYRRALAILEKAVGPSHRHVAFSLNNLALLYKAQGEHRRAEALLLRSLAIKEAVMGKDHPSVAASLSSKEITAWADYVPLSAEHNFALSDANAVQIDPAPTLQSLGSDLPFATKSNLTKAEANACPQNILFPISRSPSR